MKDLWPWLTLAALGAYHGINPGMGWLFSVALGLQERSRAAVVRSFAPIAAGHFASIAAVVALVAALETILPTAPLKYGGAVVLAGFGLYKLLAPMSHPRWVGMRVNSRQLALWSFLMATAHGAGLMVVPVVLRLPGGAAAAQPAARIVLAGSETPAAPALAAAENTAARPEPAATPADTPPACHQQAGRMAAGGGWRGLAAGLGAVSLHTLAMFLAMALIALIVYEKVGLAILRTAWFNLDLLWAFALIAAGALTAIL